MYHLPFLDLPALSHASGRVRVPGSKSISNRALLLAALADGDTLLDGLLDADDTQVMRQALSQLGIALTPQTDGAWRVSGGAGRLPVAQAELFLGNAGTAMRPLLAALAVLAARDGGHYRLDGIARMRERPVSDLIDALRGAGCQVIDEGQPGYPPVSLHGPAPMLDAPVRVRGNVSSQFVSALLMALPLAAADQARTLQIDGALISQPYVEITLAWMAHFGVHVERMAADRYRVPAGSRYRSPIRLAIEGDASSASYFVALGALAAVAAPLRIDGVGAHSVQGDLRFTDAVRAMGGQVTLAGDHLLVQRGAWPLRGRTHDCTAIPDAAMTLAVMGLYADGPTTLTGIGSWRVKETDRISAMQAELTRLGAQVETGSDWLRVTPPAPGAWRAATVHTYDDHRMAMCLSLATLPHPDGSAAQPIRLLDPGCVAKTFPDYFETLLSVAHARPADVPVITIDGPTASGKGSLSDAVASALGYHVLDSGALYRATGLAAQRAGVDLDDAPAVAALAAALPLRFAQGRAWLGEDDITDALREEATGLAASRVAAHAAVRTALHGLQLSFRRAPGLVADGRDMGTAIFPDAALKIFLTASAATRAQRRYKQLMQKGISASMEGLRADLEARDARDAHRAASPLLPAQDALELDNSHDTLEQSRDRVLAWWAQRRPF